MGPQSAGADPGPACYGRGGEAPTVTDANLVLGRLGASGLAGGAVPLDPARADAAIGRLARELGLSPLEAARGVVRVVNANMANAVRVVTVQRGVDPTALTLVPFGGAGPLHAGELARELGIPALAVPPAPGTALRSRSARRGPAHRRRADPPGARSSPAASPRSPRASRRWSGRRMRWLERERVPEARRRLERWLDLRYVGQNFELLVPVPGGDVAGRRLRRAPPALPRDARAGLRLRGRGRADPGRQRAPGRARAWPIHRGSRACHAAPGDPRAAEVGRRDVYVDDDAARRGVPGVRAARGSSPAIASPAPRWWSSSTPPRWLLPRQEALVDDLGFLVITETRGTMTPWIV